VIADGDRAGRRMRMEGKGCEEYNYSDLYFF
jgi:hypothetical protein